MSSLGDIPVLGHLFRSRREISEKRNLLVFLRPNIIRNSEAAIEVTNESYKSVRTLQLNIDEQGNFYRFMGSAKKENATLPDDMSDLYDGY